MEETIKINLGSGNEYLEGYINVDNQVMFPDAKVDLSINIKDYFANDNFADEILVSHVVMYLRPEELQPLLKKWHTILKPTGKLIIETADFKKLAKIVVSEESPSTVTNFGLINIFGKEGDPQHRWGWTKQSLSSELYRAGFSNLKVSKGLKKPNRDFTIVATK